MVSSFLSPATITKEHDLASLHLSRDQSLPVILSTEATNTADEGYAEGVVTNTRFGSFPHSTIIGTPWGSQIRASIVDTGSRGRGGPKKRKAEALEENDDGAGTKNAVTASSGFVHVLPPTPENWTTSLPHRTQVVYTPDYSYILHRIRARPGSRLIEAGSGSGSFTHAAARAVFDGYPQQDAPEADDEGGEESKSTGQVFSFEYHAERHQKVKAEMAEHGLDTVVSAFHRDVYKDGFLVGNERQTSPRANAVFLDLPAPWEALPHLTRHTLDGTPSSLDPESAVHICTFSPCIEQVQKTVSELRRHDWLEIEMVEMQHKRIDIRREYTSLQYDSLRGTNPFAVDVDEAVSKLREVEQRARDFHAGILSAKAAKALKNQQHNKLGSLPFNGGKLIHRTEPDLKTHTSYLVFALLPRAWTEEDEAVAQAKWSKHVKITSIVPKSQRQQKKEAKQKSKGTNGVTVTTEVEKEEPATEVEAEGIV